VATSDRLLEGVGLGGMAADQASAMPTGLARMVELARALAMAPKVLLLDEPGSGLDDAESQTLGELLTTLARGGMGVLLVEHDMELVMRICDFIYVLDFGDVIASGTPEQIRSDPMVQAAYLGEASTPTVGTAPGTGDGPQGADVAGAGQGTASDGSEGR
jgi:branched-chain amino acid transport system ATP-binding protein